MAIVYVAGKYMDETKEKIKKHLKEAETMAQKILLAGHIPIIPHKITAFWDKHEEFFDWGHLDWLEKFCYPLLDICDCMFVCSNYITSEGVKKEIAYAANKNKLVFFEIEEFLRHFKKDGKRK